MRERRLPAVSARPTRPLAMPSWSQRGWPRIRRTMAVHPPATTAGPRPNGMISAPLPERAQPLPEMFDPLSTIVSTHRRAPATRPRMVISPVKPGSRLESPIGLAIAPASYLLNAVVGCSHRHLTRCDHYGQVTYAIVYLGVVSGDI